MNMQTERSLTTRQSNPESKRERKTEMSEENSNTLPVRVHDDTAMANIVAALRSDGMRELMKFDKGDYKKRGGVIVPLETRFVAHVTEMQHGYVRFNDEQELVERHVARMADGHKLPDRSELSNPELEGTEHDPYVFQYYLPMEEVETDDMVVFVTGSVGGEIALTNLAQKVAREKRGRPTIELALGYFTTKKYGKTLRPDLKIVGWEINPNGILVPSDDNQPKPSLTAEMSDEIPF